MGKRKCEECGTNLTDEDVMKIKSENGSWEIVPIPLCPDCFTKRMRKLVHEYDEKSNHYH